MEMAENDQLVLFESSDGEVALEVASDRETVWLNQQQMSELFATTKQNISLHINNCFKEGELERNSVIKEFLTTAKDGKTYKTKYYNLDVIISVGYRVKSKRGVEFRKWATDVLRRYIVEGRAENDRRLAQLSQAVQIMDRIAGDIDAAQVLEVVKSYAKALDLLDDYDHQEIERPKGMSSIYILDYDECKRVIEKLRFTKESDLFGAEKDDSFKSSIAAIYQGFDGEDIYPSVQEKAANLLYFVVKNHSFHDGNKRIAASLFLYFLDKNGLLFRDGSKVISDDALVATTIMIAESNPEEKEVMVSLVMNFLM